MPFMPDQVGRLLRKKWDSTEELAQELYAMFMSKKPTLITGDVRVTGKVTPSYSPPKQALPKAAPAPTSSGGTPPTPPGPNPGPPIIVGGCPIQQTIYARIGASCACLSNAFQPIPMTWNGSSWAGVQAVGCPNTPLSLIFRYLSPQYALIAFCGSGAPAMAVQPATLTFQCSPLLVVATYSGSNELTSCCPGSTVTVTIANS